MSGPTWNEACRVAVACFISNVRKDSTHRRVDGGARAFAAVHTQDLRRFGAPVFDPEPEQDAPARDMTWQPSKREAAGDPELPRVVPDDAPNIKLAWCMEIQHCVVLVEAALAGKAVPMDVSWTMKHAHEFFDHAFEDFPETQAGVDAATSAFLFWMQPSTFAERVGQQVPADDDDEDDL